MGMLIVTSFLFWGIFLTEIKDTSPNHDAARNGAGGDAGAYPTGNDQHPASPDIQDAPPITEEEFMAQQREYMALVPDDSLPVAKSPDEWKQGLIMAKVVVKVKDEKTGKEEKQEFFVPERKSQNNIYLMTRYSEQLRGIFILNEFSRRKMVVKCPPWEKPNKFKPRDVRDDDYSRVCMELERMGLTPTRDRAVAAIEAICHDRSFHPVQKYFKSLKWDGEKRLHKWLMYYLGCEYEPAEYLSGIGMKWLVAGVARIFQPGCKFDHMLILEGLTDIGKSRVFRLLSTFHGEEYFYDGMSFDKINDKDTMQNIQGSLIIEFPELSNLQSREVEDVKQWITIQEDRGRKPYGREPVMYPRQFLLGGSTNTQEYLKDRTGNKRFWPAKCGEKIDFAALERDKAQLWAEAVALYRDGYKWWIPEGDSLFGLCAEVAKKRLSAHPWEDAVLEYVRSMDYVTISEILLKKIEKPLERQKKSDEMTVAQILRDNGFLKVNDGKRRGWERKTVQLSMKNVLDDEL